jgi:erythromycin esterase-like protein
MFDTLQALLAYHGPGSKGVVWEHNSHVGDAAATEMGACGEHNVGQLCRASFGQDAYIIGFGTDHGTVAAASDWDAPMQRMRVRPGDVPIGLAAATCGPMPSPSAISWIR